jgi:hypothetical protein
VPESAYVDEYNGDRVRAVLPSTISSGTPNMTGVGTSGGREAEKRHDMLYSTFHIPNKQSKMPRPFGFPKAVTRWRDSELSRSKSPSSAISESSSAISSDPPPNGQANGFAHNSTGQQAVPPLLSSGVFRDSAFSSNTDASHEVPIKWTGTNRGNDIKEDREDEEYNVDEVQTGKSNRLSGGPVLPGGWAPEMDKPQSPSGIQNGNGHPSMLPVLGKQDKGPDKSVHNVSSRVSAPEVRHAPEGMRRSEMASFGMMPLPGPPVPSYNPPPGPPKPSYHPPRPPLTSSTSSLPPVSFSNKGKSREMRRQPSDLSSQGWVLVNVEGKRTPSVDQAGKQLGHPPPNNLGYKGTSSSSLARTDSSKYRREPQLAQSSMSPAAKAIVIIDAVEARSKTRSPKRAMDGADSSGSGVRRFFSLSKKSSVSSSVAGTSEATKSSRVTDANVRPRKRER